MKIKFFFFIFFLSVILSLPVVGQNYPDGYTEALEAFQRKDYNASLESVRSYFDPASKSYEFRMLAASNYMNLGNYETAITHLSYCRTENPLRAEPLLLTAVALRKSGNLYGAAREIIQGINRYPQNVQFRIEMARVYFLLSKFPEARAQLDVALKLHPNHLHAMYLDGLIFIKQGRYEEAEFRLKNVLGMKSLSVSLLPPLHNNLGLVLERLGEISLKSSDRDNAVLRFKESEDHYKKALSYNSEHPVYRRNLARVSLHL